MLTGDPLRKVSRQQRGIVIAQILTEPAKALDPTPRFDGERHDESGFAVDKTANDDNGHDMIAPTDMAMPGRQPFEGLKCRALGRFLEAAPLAFNGIEIGVNIEVQVRRKFTRQFRQTVHRRVVQIRVLRNRGRTRSPKRRQWCCARHYLDRRDRGLIIALIVESP
jgi:hypothetical protein